MISLKDAVQAFEKYKLKTRA